jgi:hypothetical protein
MYPVSRYEEGGSKVLGVKSKSTHHQLPSESPYIDHHHYHYRWSVGDKAASFLSIQIRARNEMVG